VTRSTSQLLAARGPCLSSELAKDLVRSGLSPAAARKRIQRSGSGVRRLAFINFPHNDQFLYLSSQFKTEQFWRELLRVLNLTESAYGLALNALLARGGAVPRSHFDIICGSPTRMKGQLGSNSVLSGLTGTDLLEAVPHQEFGELVTCSNSLYLADNIQKPGATRARLIAEDLLLVAFSEWVRRLGLGSFSKVQVRKGVGQQPTFGQFAWDLTAPSYVPPLSKRSGEKVIPGFVVGDVLLSREILVQDVKPFLKKVNVMRAQPRTAQFLAIFVADRYNPDAFELAKKSGIVPATVDNLFGREVATGLSEMINALTNVAAILSADPGTIDRLFSKLDAIKGADLNVKGALFELIAARTLSLSGYSIQVLNDLVTNSEYGAAEIDVLATLKQEVLAVECKGYLRNRVTLAQAMDWVNKRVPNIYASLKSQKIYRERDVRFEFWSVSGFNPDAEAFILESSGRTKKYTMTIRNAEAIAQQIRETGDRHLQKLFREHYSDFLAQFAHSNRRPRTALLDENAGRVVS
jgi:hypothetical protein